LGVVEQVQQRDLTQPAAPLLAKELAEGARCCWQVRRGEFGGIGEGEATSLGTAWST
jgi:hypothetical protein